MFHWTERLYLLVSAHLKSYAIHMIIDNLKHDHEFLITDTLNIHCTQLTTSIVMPTNKIGSANLWCASTRRFRLARRLFVGGHPVINILSYTTKTTVAFGCWRLHRITVRHLDTNKTSDVTLVMCRIMFSVNQSLCGIIRYVPYRQFTVVRLSAV